MSVGRILLQTPLQQVAGGILVSIRFSAHSCGLLGKGRLVGGKNRTPERMSSLGVWSLGD